MSDFGAMRDLDLVYLSREMMVWSKETFGCGIRTEPILKHIEMEVQEVRDSKGEDPYEWIDIIILALDGALNAGFTPEEIAFFLRNKFEKNKNRAYKKNDDGVFLHVK